MRKTYNVNRITEDRYNVMKVWVVGAGIVGEATGKGLINKGNDVTFIDKVPDVVSTLTEAGFKSFSFEEVEHDGLEIPDIAMFCIQTPLKSDGSVNLDYLAEGFVTYSKFLKKKFTGKYHVIVVRSTVPPLTTKEVIIPLIETFSGLKVGRDFGLCMQPEFLRTINCEEDFLKPKAIVIGEYDKCSGDYLEALYQNFKAPMIRVDLITAEFGKYVNNCFNATKISFANEIWLIGQKLGLDVNSILSISALTAEGYWNPKYGTIGGQPFGGPCLMKDIEGFSNFASQIDIDVPLLQAAVEVNRRMEALSEEGVVPHATVEKPSHLGLSPRYGKENTIENVKQVKA
jgi:UDPglucose 6-dehydrogenase